MAKVKTTQIEKKFKKADGTFGSIKIDYAKVVDRLNEFRSDNPRGLVETHPEILEDTIIFKARILKDKADTNSAEATGHAVAKNNGGEKLFEKLETLAVGRALAMLGYAAGGEIASFEEMEDFNTWKDGKIEDAIIKMKETKTLEELKAFFMSLGSLMSDSRIIDAKDKQKLVIGGANGNS